jgi:hypothetical protein
VQQKKYTGFRTLSQRNNDTRPYRLPSEIHQWMTPSGRAGSHAISNRLDARILSMLFFLVQFVSYHFNVVRTGLALFATANDIK